MSDQKIENELQDLKDKIIFATKNALVRASWSSELNDAYNTETWKERFGRISPKTVLNILSQNCLDACISLAEDPNEIYVSFHTKNANIHGLLVKPMGQSLSEASKFKLQELNVSRGDKTGQGAAKIALANIVDLTETSFPRITSIAIGAYNIGSYAWLKFGFLPSDMFWETMKYQLNPMVDAIKDQLTGQEITAFERIFKSGDPKSLWHIVDMSREIQNPYEAGKKIEIGKYLLIDFAWPGSLELNDPQSRKRLSHYVAKKVPLQEPIPPSQRDRQLKPDKYSKH